MTKREDTQTSENARATDSSIDPELTQRRSLKVLHGYAEVYANSPPHLKETVGFTLKRNLENFKAAGGKFN